MDTTSARRLLQIMIEFFETGNQTSDSVAKLILESDFEDSDFWQKEVKKFKSGTEWSGVRAAEADIVALALRHIREMGGGQ